MIDIRKLKELVRLMVENDLTKLDLKDQQEQVLVERGVAGGVPVVQHVAMTAPAVHHAAPAAAATGKSASAAPSAAEPAAAAADNDAGLVAIVSPMVGTFYSSANPDSPAFISPGGAVSPETTVCLIEAMKVFNEIKAETTGTIERVLVTSGQAVEYGQKLFMVRPA